MTKHKLLIFLLVMIICIPLSISIIDNDMDGYCDVESIGCMADYCLNTPLGEIVDNYGCSCSQKTAATCQGEWCCQPSYDQCGESCSDIDFTAVCTQEEGSQCGLYRDCLPDGCYSTQDTFWYDFPESGHDYCQNGRCINYSCEPTIVKNVTDTSLCDYEYCQKTYGDSFSCQGSDYLESECSGSGIVVKNSSCMLLAGGRGVCVSCSSGCEDTDKGINYLEYGVVIKNDTAFPDNCFNQNTSLEYYCDIYGNVKNTTINCPDYSKVCEYGRCADYAAVTHGSQCNDVNGCGPGLHCASDLAGQSKACCNPDECYDGSVCVGSGQQEDYQDKNYMCNSGIWEEKTAMGCYITDSTCQGDGGIMSMAGLEDSHGSLYGQNPSFQYNLCCNPDNVKLDSSGDYIFSLSNPPDDAHVSVFEDSPFPNKVYLKSDSGRVQCSVRETCNDDEECLFSLSNDLSDSHIASCSSQNFKNRLCCGIFAGSGDRSPPIVSAEYDGTSVQIHTNEWAECSLLFEGTDIPCTDSGCLDHVLSIKMSSRDYVTCVDKDNNTNSGNMVGGCYDGTPIGTCSEQEPDYCNQGIIVQDCKKCGCPSDMPHCDDDGTCNSLACLESTPTTGTALSAEMLTLDDPIVRQTAEEAIEEYTQFKNVDEESINSADEYMEAVAYFVDKNMVWTPCLPYRETSRIIRESGANNCGKRFCGCCTDHAVLRTALLRSLGVSSTCVFTTHGGYVVDNLGHEYNIVKYKNAYRIMDYGPLGSYFTSRWEYHATDGLWNDYVGSYRPFVNDLPAQLTYNYPIGQHCPEGGWTDETYYTDICP